MDLTAGERGGSDTRRCCAGVSPAGKWPLLSARSDNPALSGASQGRGYPRRERETGMVVPVVLHSKVCAPSMEADLDAQSGWGRGGGSFHMQMARACWLLMHSRRSPDQPPEEP